MIIYDAENQVLGRLCSVIAKKLLNGEDITVVNCEKAVLAGGKDFTMNKYKIKVERGDPHHGPYFPKTPMDIFRRTVRGMLPWDRSKGRTAYRKLKVFIGMPAELKDKKIEKAAVSEASNLVCDYISISELSVALGAKKRW
jgi:large subunit ribosomal protein L13